MMKSTGGRFVCFVHQGNQPVLSSRRRLTHSQLPTVWRATVHLACAWWIVAGSGGVHSAVTFQFTYQDVVQRTGTGFDDPTEGEARRTALREVADDMIGSMLNHTAVVRVTVKLSTDLPDVTLAEAGQNYIISPASFQNGVVATQIQSNSTSPSDDVGGSMRWDFTHDWHTGTDAPPSGTNDFRSVALHEMTHLLGLSNLIQEDGRGLKGTFFDTYSGFDSFLENENGLPLTVRGRFNLSGGTTLGDLTTAAYFDGTHSRAANNGQRVRLFTPDEFKKGSIGHLNDRNDPLAHQLRTGTTRRHWSLVDRGILLDLGYHIPDAVVADRDEVFSGTLLDLGGNLFIGGGQTSAGLDGSLTINSNATVQASNVGIWPPGTLNVDGTMSVGVDLFNNGRLGGRGNVATHVRNVSGTVAPGNSTGQLTVNAFTQSSSGTLEIEIGGPVAGSQHDVLQVDGTAILAGQLSLLTIGSYTEPTVRGTLDSFTVLDAANVSGRFASVLYDDEPISADLTRNDGSFGMVLGNGHFRNVIHTDREVTIQNVAAVPGDTDGNLVVDLADFNRLAISFTPLGSESILSWEQGNFDEDNDIDLADFNELAVRFNQFVYNPASSSPSVVPEPPAALLLGWCSLPILYFGSRSCRRDKHANSFGLRS